MELINSGRFNDYKLPVGWGMVAASNPQGTTHRVQSMDEAQATRFIPIPYSPSREAFIDQLIKQGVEPEIVAYAMKFKEVAQEPSAVDVLPETRVVNWRNFMLYAQVYPFLKEDNLVRMAVNSAMFGPGAIPNLEQAISDTLPYSALELLGSSDEDWYGIDHQARAREGLKKFQVDRRTDLVGASVHRLVHYLNDKDTHLTAQQIDNLGQLALELPDQFSSLLLRRIMSGNAPRYEYYLDVLTHWKSPDGRLAGPVGMRMHELNQKIAAKARAFQ